MRKRNYKDFCPLLLYYDQEEGKYPKDFFVIARTRQEAIDELASYKPNLSREEKEKMTSAVYYLN